MSFVGHIEKHALTIGENQGSQANYNHAGNFSAQIQRIDAAKELLRDVRLAAERSSGRSWQEVTGPGRVTRVVAVRCAVAFLLKSMRPNPWSYDAIGSLLNRNKESAKYYADKGSGILRSGVEDEAGVRTIFCAIYDETEHQRDWVEMLHRIRLGEVIKSNRVHHLGPNGKRGISTLPLDVIEHRKSVIRVSAHPVEAMGVLGLSKCAFHTFCRTHNLKVGTHFCAVLDRLKNWENRHNA